MARQKKPVHRVQMTDGKRNIIRQLLEEYDIETAEDIQDAFKDLLGGTLKEMMEAEMDEHLGYEKSERSDNDDYRNGYKRKQVNSGMVLWKSKYHKIESPPLNHRLSKSVRRIFLTLTRRLSPCMPKE